MIEAIKMLMVLCVIILGGLTLLMIILALRARQGVARPEALDDPVRPPYSATLNGTPSAYRRVASINKSLSCEKRTPLLCRLGRAGRVVELRRTVLRGGQHVHPPQAQPVCDGPRYVMVHGEADRHSVGATRPQACQDRRHGRAAPQLVDQHEIVRDLAIEFSWWSR